VGYIQVDKQSDALVGRIDEIEDEIAHVKIASPATATAVLLIGIIFDQSVNETAKLLQKIRADRCA